MYIMFLIIQLLRSLYFSISLRFVDDVSAEDKGYDETDDDDDAMRAFTRSNNTLINNSIAFVKSPELMSIVLSFIFSIRASNELQSE
jgi:hypothetical protein